MPYLQIKTSTSTTTTIPVAQGGMRDNQEEHSELGEGEHFTVDPSAANFSSSPYVDAYYSGSLWDLGIPDLMYHPST